MTRELPATSRDVKNVLAGTDVDEDESMWPSRFLLQQSDVLANTAEH